ncbi:HEL033Cp [Eremothecium sinecaudum]|uniref:mitogen-activated protein kinase kinase n=1 Tax=Eremothecium sinecaudum TaxID=45286 RepID=A0A0X8HTI7_9SACH|nr:HEL033Cp [Eremothecium sinecaudum]AMD21247.1 HEL033Cp [Eremothecium sinecaudum]
MNQQNIFQPKSLKRKNLKRLQLDHGGESFAVGGCDGVGVVSGDKKNALVGSKVTLHMKRLNRPLSLDIERASVKSKVVIAQPSPTASEHSVNSLSPVTPDPVKCAMLDESFANNFSRLSIFEDGKKDIQLEDLVQLGKIGAGNSGTVVKTLHVPDSRIIAKKSIPVENSELVKNQLMRELTIMKNVKEHDNIVGFYGAYYTSITNHEIIILMEYMDCGSLDKISGTYKRACNRNKEPINYSTSWFTELSLSKISYAILKGLSYLHREYKIIHRDIKPSNILINSKGCVKICDFGVSKKMIDSIADTFVGTSTYMSPERIQGSCYSTKGDVWSLGLMIIELVTGEFPLGGHNDTPEGILDLLQRIVNESPPSLPASAGLSADIIDFVNCCCVKDERNRSSLTELMKHNYIMKYTNNSDYQRKFRRWCKKIKKMIKEDKMYQREEIEKAKIVNRQLERSAQAAAAARCGGR